VRRFGSTGASTVETFTSGFPALAMILSALRARRAGRAGSWLGSGLTAVN